MYNLITLVSQFCLMYYYASVVSEKRQRGHFKSYAKQYFFNAKPSLLIVQWV